MQNCTLFTDGLSTMRNVNFSSNHPIVGDFEFMKTMCSLAD